MPQVDHLQRRGPDHALVCLHVDNVVVIGQQVAQLEHLEHHLGQRDKRIVRDVQPGQELQVAQLVGQLGHLVVGQVQFYEWEMIDYHQGTAIDKPTYL